MLYAENIQAPLTNVDELETDAAGLGEIFVNSGFAVAYENTLAELWPGQREAQITRDREASNQTTYVIPRHRRHLI